VAVTAEKYQCANAKCPTFEQEQLQSENLNPDEHWKKYQQPVRCRACGWELSYTGEGADIYG
jgi:hypothetical protein